MKKKKILILVLILIIALGVVAYFFFKKDTVDMRCEDGFRFVPSSQTCEPVDGQKNTDELDFSKIQIKTPGGSEYIQFQKEGDTTKYSGKAEVSTGKGDDSQMSKTTVYASFDSKDAVKYSDELTFIPFLFDGGGTGQFVYLGLFETASGAYLDSMSIGDRIAISSIVVVNDKAKVNFKERYITDSFAEAPSIPTQFVVEVKEKKIVLIMKLQNADYGDVEIKSITSTNESVFVRGAIPGTWYFEANARFRVLDDTYTEIGVGSIQALSDWMTVQRVPFEIMFSTASVEYTGKATIIVEADDPRGDDESQRALKKMYLPIEIK